MLALPNELSIEKNKELLEEFINTRFTSRGLISTYAIHNEKVLSKLNEIKIGKTNSKENEGIKDISEKLYQVINPDLQKDKNGQIVNYNEIDNYEKYVTNQYIEAYQKTYKVGMGVKAKKSITEYANILVNKGLEKAKSVTDLIENSIKQAICFEIIRKDENIKELTKDGLQEIHKKAEILASQIEHKDLNYENKYKFENMKKETSENIEKSQKVSDLSGQEIDRLSEIIQNEKALEMQKQHELQIQQSLQKSRGYEIEI